MSYTDLLRNVSLFAQLNEDELEALAAEFMLQSFRRGQVLFQQGSTTSSLYIVKTGAIQITAFARQAEITYTDTFRPEQYFGEYALLDGLPRSGEAVALAPSDLLVLTRPTFFRFLEKHPTVAVKLLVVVSRRMRFAESAIDKPIVRNDLQKTARLLLTIAAHYQVMQGDDMRLTVRLSSDDLAALAGITRASAREITDHLRDIGAITTERTHIATVHVAILQDQLRVMIDIE